MQTLSTELKGVIGRRLEVASSREILAIASALCADDLAPAISRDTVPLIQSRFDVDGDVVRDHSTGLIWSRGNVGTKRLEWKEAQEACKILSLGGFSDWRLPTIKELLSLVDYDRHEPAIDTDAFECESSWYWSATPLHASPGVYAWFVYFDYGGAYWGYQDGEGFVRAVRVGQF